MPTRNVHWGMSWGVVDDSMLLVGMLIYGVGNWDAIKNDPKLDLSSKVYAHFVFTGAITCSPCYAEVVSIFTGEVDERYVC